MEIRLKKILPTYFDAGVTERSEIWGKDISFNKGEFVKIVAPSGSGKTSLVHFLYGLRNEYFGDIQFNEKVTRNFSILDYTGFRQKSISIVFQDLRLFPEQTAFDNIEIKRQLNPFHPVDRIYEMAGRLGIEKKLHNKSRICSYGEQQRIAIIRALMQPFDFLFLDEPFSHLDTENAQLAMELMLEESERRNAAIIFADLERIDYFPFQTIYHL